MIPENFNPVGWKVELLVTGGITVGLFALAGVLLVLGLYLAKRKNAWRDSGEGTLFSSAAVAVVALIPALLWVAMLVPFSSEYHHIYRVEGNVTSVTNTFQESGGELSSVPVISLDSVDRPISMSDPRAVTLEGKDVTLTCAIGWNYQAADKYSCSIYSIDKEN